MFWILFLVLSSVVLSLVSTPLVRKLALRYNCGVDHPNEQRKIHKMPVPRIGGIPVVFAYMGAIGMLVTTSHTFPHVHHFAWRLLAASLLVFFTGLVDDIIGLKPWQKLLCEIFAAFLAYLSGIQIQTIGSHHIPSFLSLPLTVSWIIGCTNAFNLIDGLDGLAVGTGLLAAITSMAAGLLQGNLGLVVATAPLAGALLGFLYFNFNPASIFLGDGGSLWTGFLLACFGVIWSNKSIAVMSMTAPLLALCLPLMDTTLAILRRFLRGQSIFHADRGHIHHRLLERGLSTRRAVIVLYGVSALAASCSLLQINQGLSVRLLVLTIFTLFAWTGIRYLAYQEFGVAALVLRISHLLSTVQCRLRLCDYEALLSKANTIDDCWHALKAIRKELEFSKVQMRLCGRYYEAAFRPSASGCWNLQIPLSDSEYIRFVGQHEYISSASIVIPLAEMLYRVLSKKIGHFHTQIHRNGATIEVNERFEYTVGAS